MDKIEEFLGKIDLKFEVLNNKITTLQDIILNMKNEFDLLNRTKIDNQCISELTSISESNLDLFIGKRPDNCKVLDQCTTLVERTTMKVLNTYMKEGIKAAQNRLERYIKLTEEYLESGRCCDENCMDNLRNNYLSLQSILKSNQLHAEQITSNLFEKKHLYNIIDGSEKEDCKMLTPLSNELRIKILKTLSKGGAYYTQLEREVGLKGGHFHFHLDKLIEGGYVNQDGEKGFYVVTLNGLKALKFLFNLKKEFSTSML